MEYILTVNNAKSNIHTKGTYWCQDWKPIVVTISHSKLPRCEWSSDVFAMIYSVKLQTKV